MSKIETYPDGYNLQDGDYTIISRQGRTYRVSGAGILRGAVSAESFDDYKTLYDLKIGSLEAQNANLTAIVASLVEEEAITLGALTLSTSNFNQNTAFSVNIIGKTSGSTITASSSEGSELVVSGNTLTGTFSGIGTQSITLFEDLPGALNNPNFSTIPVTISVYVPPAVPAIPTITVVAGDGKNTITWADGDTNGSATTAREVYRSTTNGFTPPGSGTLVLSFSAPGILEDTTAVNGTTYYYKGIQTNGVGPSLPSAQKSGTPTAAPQISIFTNTANGMAIGQVADSSIYSGKINGLKLVAQDDFINLPNMYSGGAMTDYAANTGHVPTTPVGEGFFAYPGYRGVSSQSPTPLGYQQMSVASSVLTMTARVPTSGELAFLPTTGFNGAGPPKIMTASLKTGPSFAISAQAAFALVMKVRFAPGVIRGSWESGYICSTIWPDGQEADMFEVKRSGSTVQAVANINGSTTDGGGNSPAQIGAYRTMPTDRDVTILMRKDANGTDIAIYDDTAVQGTISASPVAIYSNARVGRFKGAHDLRIDWAINTQWDSTTFDSTDFPKIFQVDFWQVWTASSRTASNPVELGVVNTTAGAVGGWNYTLPSLATLYGSDPPDLEQAMVQFSNLDNPGTPHSNWVMAGSTVNLTTRAVTGNVPSGKAGRVRLKIVGTYNSGGPAKISYVTYNIAPIASAVFNNQSVALSGSGTLNLPFTAFISGDLNHTYTVVSDKAWAVVTMGAGNKSATIAYTAPSSNDVATITITATNSAGQATVATRTITATSAYDPVADSNVVEFWDFNNNASVFSDAGTTQAVAGSSSVKQVNGQKGVANLVDSSPASSPSYVVDGVTSRKAVNFTRTSVQRLVTNSSAVAAVASGNNTGYTVVEAVRRGTVGQSVTTTSWFQGLTAVGQRTVIRHFIGSGNTVGALRLALNVASTPTTVASTATTTDQWYVITRIYSGTNIIIRLNGVEIFNGAFTSDPLTVNNFSIGADYNNASAAWESSSAFGGKFDSIYLLTTSTLNSSVSGIEQRAAAAIGVTLP